MLELIQRVKVMKISNTPGRADHLAGVSWRRRTGCSHRKSLSRITVPCVRRCSAASPDESTSPHRSALKCVSNAPAALEVM